MTLVREAAGGGGDGGNTIHDIKDLWETHQILLKTAKNQCIGQ